MFTANYAVRIHAILKLLNPLGDGTVRLISGVKGKDTLKYRNDRRFPAKNVVQNLQSVIKRTGIERRLNFNNCSDGLARNHDNILFPKQWSISRGVPYDDIQLPRAIFDKACARLEVGR